MELHKYSTRNFVTRHKIIDKPHINVINDLLNPHDSDETIKAQKTKNSILKTVDKNKFMIVDWFVNLFFDLKTPVVLIW